MNSHPLFSLKGWHIIAQGNALGLVSTLGLSPERAKQTADPSVVMPFQGEKWLKTLFPRALPWAILFCPFGAKDGITGYAVITLK